MSDKSIQFLADCLFGYFAFLCECFAPVADNRGRGAHSFRMQSKFLYPQYSKISIFPKEKKISIAPGLNKGFVMKTLGVDRLVKD
jgi:hypothetical protein